MSNSYRLGIDIGGTFTDAMLADDEGKVVATLKTPSVPAAPEQAIFNALQEIKDLSFAVEDINLFVHGTTLGVNTLIERNGAVTGMLVTSGFRDVLEIRRLRLANTTDLYGEKTVPLVPRYLVKEIKERCLFDGQICQPLALDEVRQAVSGLQAEGVTAIAVCFLHAYQNPTHEKMAYELIQQEFPELFVCTSSDIWPQQREYERCLAAVINAYIGSRMRNYFCKLEAGVSQYGLKARVLSTMSNGGIMTATRAAEEPVKTLLSGPASGVIGATHVARMAGIDRIITFDMGGTSAHVALIDGEPGYSTENQVGDFSVIIPAVDVNAIGAGGGSIAWVDSAGILKVGPRSAGADPGPACYNRGGKDATTTDAYVHLGIIHPNRFLGGKMRLRSELAEQALTELGDKLELSSREAAQAILDVATANMYAKFTPLMARKGIDPRDFTLLAYGGAGPTHAFLLAREVGIRRVLIPPSPGTLCAMGCVVADLRNDFVYTLYKNQQQLQTGELKKIFSRLLQQGKQWVEKECSEGIAMESVYMLYSLDMRYEGQAFEIEVSVSESECEDAERAARLFHEKYHSIFGVSQPDAPISFINLRATVVGVTHKLTSLKVPSKNTNSCGTEIRPVYFENQLFEAKVIQRAAVNLESALTGPVVIEDYDTTIFVPPGYRVHADVYGNIMGEAE